VTCHQVKAADAKRAAAQAAQECALEEEEIKVKSSRILKSLPAHTPVGNRPRTPRALTPSLSLCVYVQAEEARLHSHNSSPPAPPQPPNEQHAAANAELDRKRESLEAKRKWATAHEAVAAALSGAVGENGGLVRAEAGLATVSSLFQRHTPSLFLFPFNNHSWHTSYTKTVPCACTAVDCLVFC